MNSSRRPMVVMLTLALALGVMALWAWGYLDDQRNAAAASARELADCVQLARRISAARTTTAAAPRPPDLTSAIAAAASDSGMAEGSLDRIDPAPINRDTNIQAAERKIDISIQQVGMEPFLKFARAVSVAPLNLRVSRLRLTPSQSAGGGWAAEMTLTYAASGDLRE